MRISNERLQEYAGWHGSETVDDLAMMARELLALRALERAVRDDGEHAYAALEALDLLGDVEDA